jgi:hypothetical protein
MHLYREQEVKQLEDYYGYGYKISSYLGSGNYRTPFMKHRQITYKEHWVSMLSQSISNDYLLSSLHGGIQLTSHGCEVPNEWSRVI